MSIPEYILELFEEGSKIKYEPIKDLEDLESLDDNGLINGYRYGRNKDNMTILPSMTRSEIYGFLNAKYHLGELEIPDYLLEIQMQYIRKYF